MRELTDAEVRVVRALLAAGTENERERLRLSGLPRSTYHAARRRAYAEGWLRDRYLPDPLVFGFPSALLCLGRPFAERAGELAQRWGSEPSNVLLWTSPQIHVGVFLLAPSAGPPERLAGRLNPPDLVRPVENLVLPLADPSFPVYFDFEGSFANLADLSGTRAYPRGLGGPSLPGQRRMTVTSDGLRRSAQELLARPFATEDRASHLMGPLGLPRSQRRLVEQGWVQRRVLLDPGRLPGYRGRAADEVVLITGRLRSGAEARALLTLLTAECRVFPFLFATGGGKVLVGALGQGAAAPGDARRAARRPVLETLQGSLEGIEVVSERAASFQVPVDHRYDRLFASAASGRAG